LKQPVPCHGRCTLGLSEGTYSLRIQTYRRNWMVPVVVSGGQTVNVGVPNRDTHSTGIILTVVGGTIISAVGLFAYVTLILCADRGQQESPPLEECEGEPFIMDTLPWVLGLGGAGLALTGVGVGLILSTKNPSVEIASASATRRRDGTFIGLAPIAGAGPGLVLRTAF
jgi:hypothetical protein